MKSKSHCICMVQVTLPQRFTHINHLCTSIWIQVLLQHLQLYVIEVIEGRLFMMNSIKETLCLVLVSFWTHLRCLILWSKIPCLGLEATLELFRSYLEHRRLFVDKNGEQSGLLTVLQWVIVDAIPVLLFRIKECNYQIFVIKQLTIVPTR